MSTAIPKMDMRPSLSMLSQKSLAVALCAAHACCSLLPLASPTSAETMLLPPATKDGRGLLPPPLLTSSGRILLWLGR